MPPTYDSSTVPAISVSELTHSFKGHQALNQVSFAVMPQTLHGFVGPNGAGKTTTLKAICTLLKLNWGEVNVFGHSVRADPISVREKIGFMPDHFSMYRQMTVFEYLDFFAAAYGLNLAQRDKVIDDVLTLTDMDGRRNDLISGLSRGMQQRVSLARVLVHDPDLLLHLADYLARTGRGERAKRTLAGAKDRVREVEWLARGDGAFRFPL